MRERSSHYLRCEEHSRQIAILNERYLSMDKLVSNIASSLEKISQLLNETVRPQFMRADDNIKAHADKLDALTKIAEEQKTTMAKLEKMQEKQGIWLKAIAAIVGVMALTAFEPAASKVIAAILHALAL